jgi:hypothetical protein
MQTSAHRTHQELKSFPPLLLAPQSLLISTELMEVVACAGGLVTHSQQNAVSGVGGHADRQFVQHPHVLKHACGVKMVKSYNAMWYRRASHASSGSTAPHEPQARATGTDSYTVACPAQLLATSLVTACCCICVMLVYTLVQRSVSETADST